MEFRLPIAFDLNNLAALTALRLTAPPVRLAFSFGAGSGLTAWLVVMAVLIGATAFVGPVPIIAPFLIAGAALVGILPHVVLAMIGRVLFNHIDQVLAPLRLLQSPAAVPSGVFEAFGRSCGDDPGSRRPQWVRRAQNADDALDGASAFEPRKAAAARTGRSPPAAAGDHLPVPPTAPGTIPRRATRDRNRDAAIVPSIAAFFLRAGQSTATIHIEAAELGIRHELPQCWPSTG